MVLMTVDTNRPLLFKDKCHAGNMNGGFCELHKNHKGPHKLKDVVWEGNYCQCGVELIKALNKDRVFDISITPELSRVYGNIFDEVTEKMDYSFCGDCEYKRDC